jgi:hypothetical protein
MAVMMKYRKLREFVLLLTYCIMALTAELIAAVLASVFLKDLAGTGDRKGMPAFWETSNQRDELIPGVKFYGESDNQEAASFNIRNIFLFDRKEMMQNRWNILGNNIETGDQY